MRPRDKTAAEIAAVGRPMKVARMDAREQVRAVLGTSQEQERQDFMLEGFANTTSLVNYAKAPIGAKKYDAASLTR